ncbi:Gp37-like protein, partial [Enterococcus faecium]|uniref:Gp37-like protein n=1 Tax=Enterococcus faecium TaxID=1352 RepID=UPI0021D59E90
IDEEARARPLIRLWDKQMQYIGTVAAEKSVDAEEMLHDTGTGDIVLRGDDWHVEFMRSDVRKDEDLHITIDPYPHRRNWRWRWN